MSRGASRVTTPLTHNFVPSSPQSTATGGGGRRLSSSMGLDLDTNHDDNISTDDSESSRKNKENGAAAAATATAVVPRIPRAPRNTTISVLVHPSKSSTLRNNIRTYLGGEGFVAPCVSGTIATIVGTHPTRATINLPDTFGPGSVLNAEAHLTAETNKLETCVEVNDIGRRVQLLLHLIVETSCKNNKGSGTAAMSLTPSDRETTKHIEHTNKLKAAIREHEDREIQMKQSVEDLKFALVDREKSLEASCAEVEKLNEEVQNLREDLAYVKAIEEARKEERAKEQRAAAEHAKIRQKERDEISRNEERRAAEARAEEDRRSRREVERKNRQLELQQLQKERDERERERVLERERENARQREREAASAREAEWRVTTMKLIQQLGNCQKCAELAETRREMEELKQAHASLNEKYDALQKENQELREREESMMHPTLNITSPESGALRCIPNAAATPVFEAAEVTFSGTAHMGTMTVEVLDGYEPGDVVQLLCAAEDAVPTSYRLRLVNNTPFPRILDSVTGMHIGFLADPTGPNAMRLMFTPEVACMAADVTLLLQNVVLTTRQGALPRNRVVRVTIDVRLKTPAGTLHELHNTYTSTIRLVELGITGPVSEHIMYGEYESCYPLASLTVAPPTNWRVRKIELTSRGPIVSYEILRGAFRVDLSGAVIRGTEEVVGSADGKILNVMGREVSGVARPRRRSIAKDITRLQFRESLSAEELVALFQSVRAVCTAAQRHDVAWIDVAVYLEIDGGPSTELSLVRQLNIVSDPSELEIACAPTRTLRCRATPKCRLTTRQQCPFVGISVLPDVDMRGQCHQLVGGATIECAILNPMDGDTVNINTRLVNDQLAFDGTSLLTEPTDGLHVGTVTQTSPTYLKVVLPRTGDVTTGMCSKILKCLAFATDSLQTTQREVQVSLTIASRTVLEVSTYFVVASSAVLNTNTKPHIEYHDADPPTRLVLPEVREDELVPGGLVLRAEVLVGSEPGDVIDVHRELLDGGYIVDGPTQGVRTIMCGDEPIATIHHPVDGTCVVRFRCEVIQGLNISQSAQVVSKFIRRLNSSTHSGKKMQKWGPAREAVMILRGFGYHCTETAAHRIKVMRVTITDGDGCVTDLLVNLRVRMPVIARSTTHNSVLPAQSQDPYVALCPDGDLTSVEYDVARPLFIFRVDCPLGGAEGDSLGLLPVRLQKKVQAAERAKAAENRRPSMLAVRAGARRRASNAPPLLGSDTGAELFTMCDNKIVTANGAVVGSADFEGLRAHIQIWDQSVHLVQRFLRCICYVLSSTSREGTRSVKIHVKAGKENGVELEMKCTVEIEPPLLAVVPQHTLQNSAQCSPCLRVSLTPTAEKYLPATSAVSTTLTVEILCHNPEIVRESLSVGWCEGMVLTTSAPRALYTGKTFLAEIDTEFPFRVGFSLNVRAALTPAQLDTLVHKISLVVETNSGCAVNQLMRLIRVTLSTPKSGKHVVYLPTCVTITTPSTKTRERPILFALHNVIPVPATARSVHPGVCAYVANSMSNVTACVEVSLPHTPFWTVGIDYTRFSRDYAQKILTSVFVDGTLKLNFLSSVDVVTLVRLIHAIEIQRTMEPGEAVPMGTCEVTIALLGHGNALHSDVLITLNTVTPKTPMPSTPETRTIRHGEPYMMDLMPKYTELEDRTFFSGCIRFDVHVEGTVELVDVALAIVTTYGVMICSATHSVFVDGHRCGCVDEASHMCVFTLEDATPAMVQAIVRSMILHYTPGLPMQPASTMLDNTANNLTTTTSSGSRSPLPNATSKDVSFDLSARSPPMIHVSCSVTDVYLCTSIHEIDVRCL